MVAAPKLIVGSITKSTLTHRQHRASPAVASPRFTIQCGACLRRVEAHHRGDDDVP